VVIGVVVIATGKGEKASMKVHVFVVTDRDKSSIHNIGDASNTARCIMFFATLLSLSSSSSLLVVDSGEYVVKDYTHNLVLFDGISKTFCLASILSSTDESSVFFVSDWSNVLRRAPLIQTLNYDDGRHHHSTLTTLV